MKRLYLTELVKVFIYNSGSEHQNNSRKTTSSLIKLSSLVRKSGVLVIQGKDHNFQLHLCSTFHYSISSFGYCTLKKQKSSHTTLMVWDLLSCMK